MKKRLLAVMAAVMTLSSSLTAFAAPQTMKDGTVFDADYYAQQNPDVVAVYGTDAGALYSHYVKHGKAEGRMSHMAAADDALFDASYYAQQNPDVVSVYGTDANALYSHYIKHGKAEGRKSHMLAADDATFDASYYAQQNPDVVAVYGTNADALYSHYIKHGKTEGRMGHMAAADTAPVDTSFNASYYAQQNPDVVAVYGTDSGALYNHYETHGRSEGRKSHR